ncbi:MAG: hypothetical protein E5W27_04365 [Mesorhizobium sp.]|nr:MAG: hypothetical protein E5W27_04365 [Mesorhizobium sp.]
MRAFANTGTLADWGSSLEGYLVSCRPDGVKTDVVCSVVERGTRQSLHYGWYLYAENEYPAWNTALGADCSDRYRDYRNYVDATGKRIGAEPNYPDLAQADPRFYFDCYNRVQN